MRASARCDGLRHEDERGRASGPMQRRAERDVALASWAAALDRASCWAEVGSGLRERREGGSGPRAYWPRRRGGARPGLRKWAASGKGGRPDWVSCWVGPAGLRVGFGFLSFFFSFSFSNSLKSN